MSPGVGRHILNRWTTREVLSFTILKFWLLSRTVSWGDKEGINVQWFYISYKDVSFLSFISVNRLSLKIFNIV